MQPAPESSNSAGAFYCSRRQHRWDGNGNDWPKDFLFAFLVRERCCRLCRSISASPELVFFLDRRMDTFFLIEAQVDAETGPSADPHTSRARPYASV